MALLIKLDTNTGSIITGRYPMRHYVDLADSLHFEGIRRRLQTAYAHVIAAGANSYALAALSRDDLLEMAMTADDANEKIDVNNDFAPSVTADSSAEAGTVSDSITAGNIKAGYEDIGLNVNMHVASKNNSSDSAAAEVSSRNQLCAVDRVSLRDLT